MGARTNAGAVSVDAQEARGVPGALVYSMTVKFGGLAPIETKLPVSGPIWSESVYSDLTMRTLPYC